VNLVSQCCKASVSPDLKREYPLGGTMWSQTFKIDVCESCQKECETMEVCEVCGEVDCLGGAKMSYKDSDSPTDIHTRINDTLRISSAWRTYGNENFTSMAWETFLWEGERIIKEFDTLQNAENVVELHFEILSRYKGDKPNE
jgi:hypothetical protein